jgi:hypothetical protein
MILQPNAIKPTPSQGVIGMRQGAAAIWLAIPAIEEI